MTIIRYRTSNAKPFYLCSGVTGTIVRLFPPTFASGERGAHGLDAQSHADRVQSQEGKANNSLITFHILLYSLLKKVQFFRQIFVYYA